MRKFFALFFLFFMGVTKMLFSQVYESEQFQIETETRDAEKRERMKMDPYPSSAVNVNEEQSEVDNLNSVLPDLSEYYKIQSISISESSHFLSEADEQKFKQEADSEFELNKFYISLEDRKLIKQNRKSGLFSIYQLSISRVEIKIECTDCNTPPFRLLELSDTKLVFAEKLQDEGADFEFIFTFSK